MRCPKCGRFVKKIGIGISFGEHETKNFDEYRCKIHGNFIVRVYNHSIEWWTPRYVIAEE